LLGAQKAATILFNCILINREITYDTFFHNLFDA